METRYNVILLQEVCSQRGLSRAFIDELAGADIIQVISIGGQEYLDEEEVEILYRAQRLHEDLGLSADALGVIEHLLKQQRVLQLRLDAMNDRLKLMDEGFEEGTAI